MRGGGGGTRIRRRRGAQLLQLGIGEPVERFPDGKLVLQLRVGIDQQGVKLHPFAGAEEITELLLVGDGAQSVQVGLVGAVLRHLLQQLVSVVMEITDQRDFAGHGKGVEPLTARFVAEYSIQLSYRRII